MPLKHSVSCPEPEIHISSDEDPNGVTDDQSCHTIDLGAQESSSTASSADNGELQTPSPQYSEPSVTTYKAEPDVQQDIDLQSVDPNLARLLTSLSMSASGIPVEDGKAKAAPETIQAVPLPSSTPLSHSETLRTSHSSRTPSVVPRSVQPSPAISVSGAPSQDPSSHLPTHPTTLDVNPHPPPVANITNAPHSPVSRRPGIMSVETSPYFSRATAVPAIPKQMKYHAMLEHVVKESERMTPKLERQAMGHSVQGPFPSSMNGPIPPSTSVPPPHAAAYNDPPVIYSSNPGGLPLRSRNIPPSSSTVRYMDPRPQTSNTFHPIPYSNHLSRASMNDDQLRSIMSIPQARPPTAQPAFHPSQPFLRPQPQFAQGAYPHSLHFPGARPAPPPLRVAPPFAQAGPAGSLPVSPLSPNFIPSRPNLPPANAQLLNILNTPSLPRAPPVVAPPPYTNRA